LAANDDADDVIEASSATEPLRYFSVIVSKFTRVDAATVALDIVPPAQSLPHASAAAASARLDRSRLDRSKRDKRSRAAEMTAP
jgi:hypothetical protein